SLHVVRGDDRLADFDAGGVEPLEADPETFRRALLRENRTLKRALTDPRIVSGVGNAHSDEILLRAGLSPLKRTGRLDPDQIESLYRATREHLTAFTEVLREEIGDGFPDRITAFHPAMDVHGRFGDPCPRCGAPIQRIVYAERETNYCPECQTGGKVLKDRAISRFLGDDWPRSLEELEERGLPGAGGEG
ncbi:MAG: formamidopyrimidine-DNA glycosylase, partial [Gemmatimonadetes bacterium]|nr:formamidopyrimidine-DNA glycosylase [Gemmatimonadota bacterium]NIR76956.1 formamidopyrimidine-DNA glycosylase [Gemmatimonadota bacterium]NIT85485.1 formamidopyrimidine-DNA glycosylase [Gemmatimonadota bacterium]NIU29309.1 formamidopyrimidine-DNA glycosylase [Gemmatimonadota bacterium]NIU34386.1 formamidopyrimidine-DNA glycosylase [Gemmatimonadota bacterium]